MDKFIAQLLIEEMVKDNEFTKYDHMVVSLLVRELEVTSDPLLSSKKELLHCYEANVWAALARLGEMTGNFRSKMNKLQVAEKPKEIDNLFKDVTHRHIKKMELESLIMKFMEAKESTEIQTWYPEIPKPLSDSDDDI